MTEEFNTEEYKFQCWMAELYIVALNGIGEEKMQQSSWYYTNNNVWKGAYEAGFDAKEAYWNDKEACQ